MHLSNCVLIFSMRKDVCCVCVCIIVLYYFMGTFMRIINDIYRKLE